MKHLVKRRQFLKAAGVMLSLPLMESFSLPLSAASKTNNKKTVKRYICLTNNYGIYPQTWFPKTGGSNYELTGPLAALKRHQKDITVWSNLDHGYNLGHAGIPSLTNGVLPKLASFFPEGNLSLDQKFAEFVGPATRYSSLVINCNDDNRICYSRTGVPIPAIDMRKAYKALFLKDDAKAIKLQKERNKLDTSILDVVLDDAKAVTKELGKQDKEKFEEYLHSVRTMEKNIVQSEPWLDRPKPQTSLKEPQPKGSNAHDLKLVMDLAAAAILTDSTRNITITTGYKKGDHELTGGNYHGYSHHGEKPESVRALNLIEKNMMTQFAYLMDLLKKQPDPINGGTLLDHTMIFFGCGMSTGEHSNKNLPLLLAGGGFKHGQHHIMPEEKGKRIPAANLMLSMAQCYGLEIDHFGASKGTLRGLEWS